MSTRTPKPKCEHAWRLYAHMDGCHWYSNAYTCDKCGATQVKESERRIVADGFAMMHMHPESCDRCRELVDAGAQPWNEREA